jgi:putative heme-binding domain-containing protein
LGQANGLGPGLLEIRTRSKDQLLAHIVEPNVSVRPDYATQVVESKAGDNLVGILADENRFTLTLAQVGSPRLVWPLLNVNVVRPQSWSLMPEGLEQGMAVQDMADLLEYLVRGTVVR